MLSKYSFLFYSLSVLLFTAFVTLTFTSCGIDESKNGSTNSVKTFAVTGSWSGKNGEVILSVAADQQYVYAAAGDAGLIILNRRDYSIAGVFTNFTIDDIRIHQNLDGKKIIFTAIGSTKGIGGAALLDATTPSNIIVNSIFTQANMSGRDIDTDYSNRIYLADELNGYSIFQYDANKNTILMVYSSPTNTPPGYRIMLYNKRVYISCREKGLLIIDPKTGKIIGKMKHALSIVNSIYPEKENSLIIADKMEGISFYEDSNPSNPKFITSYDTSGDANDLIFDKNELTIADGISGVIKLRKNSNATFTLIRIFKDGSLTYRIFYDPAKKEFFVACGKDGLRVLE